jgi:hypothetical protein
MGSQDTTSQPSLAVAKAVDDATLASGGLIGEVAGVPRPQPDCTKLPAATRTMSTARRVATKT